MKKRSLSRKGLVSRNQQSAASLAERKQKGFAKCERLRSHHGQNKTEYNATAKCAAGLRNAGDPHTNMRKRQTALVAPFINLPRRSVRSRTSSKRATPRLRRPRERKERRKKNTKRGFSYVRDFVVPRSQLRQTKRKTSPSRLPKLSLQTFPRDSNDAI